MDSKFEIGKVYSAALHTGHKKDTYRFIVKDRSERSLTIMAYGRTRCAVIEKEGSHEIASLSEPFCVCLNSDEECREKLVYQVTDDEYEEVYDIFPDLRSAENYISAPTNYGMSITAVPEYRYAVIRTEESRHGAVDISTFCMDDTLADCISYAEKLWYHLTKEEQKYNTVEVVSVKADYEINGNVWEVYYRNGADMTAAVDMTVTVGQNGNSLTVPITDAARKLDIQKGDRVKVTVEKIFRENC